jgi:hypothetical protein
MPPNSPEYKDVVMQEDDEASDSDTDELVQLDRELALDNERPRLTLLEQLDMIQWDVYNSEDTRYDSDDNRDQYI